MEVWAGAGVRPWHLIHVMFGSLMALVQWWCDSCFN